MMYNISINVDHFRGIILALVSRPERLKRFIFNHLLLLQQRVVVVLFVKRDGAEQGCVI